MLSHSYSAISMYENCPKRYYHQRITKEVKDEGSVYSLYGNRIHEALERRLKGKCLSQEAKDYEAFCCSVDSLAGQQGAKLYVEHKLTLNEDIKPTTWFAKDAWLRSILDVLIIQGDKAVIIDWKTGKRKPDSKQLQMFALSTFSHFPEVQQVKASFIWLKAMAMDTEIYKREDTPAMWEDLIERISRINRSLHNNKWPPRPSGLCRFCPAKMICEYAIK